MKNALAASTIALTLSAPISANANEDYCALIGGVGMMIMQDRIDGEKIIDTRHRFTSEIDQGNYAVLQFVNGMVDAAYSIDVPGGAQPRAEMVQDFGYVAYTLCVEATGG